MAWSKTRERYAIENPQGDGWGFPYRVGINEGPTVIMIANYFDDFPWRLMRNCPYLLTGLRKAGFHGGWLDATIQARAE
jgi:hypothetical protein